MIRHNTDPTDHTDHKPTTTDPACEAPYNLATDLVIGTLGPHGDHWEYLVELHDAAVAEFPKDTAAARTSLAEAINYFLEGMADVIRNPQIRALALAGTTALNHEALAENVIALVKRERLQANKATTKS